MKILITGGHLTPALSFIDFVQAHHPKDKLVFVGREFSQDTTGQKAIEQYEVEKRGIRFVPFQAVRINLGFFRRFIPRLTHFIRSFRQAGEILRRERPTVVLSFGGYVAVPFALAAKFARIPVVTHEQTIVSGFANKFIGLVAYSVAVTFPESTSRFLAAKTVVTGNPLRAGVFRQRHPQPTWLKPRINQPIIIVLGGNQGSRTLNNVIETSLSELLSDWVVVHQCGRPTAGYNAREILARRQQRLPVKIQERYYIREWIDDHDLFWLYRHAFCAISRAGANATQELAAAGLPSILIPLPTARLDEQRKNARWLVKVGGAMILEQTALNTTTLLAALKKMQTFEQSMRESLAHVRLPENAGERLYQVVVDALLKP